MRNALSALSATLLATALIGAPSFALGNGTATFSMSKSVVDNTGNITAKQQMDAGSGQQGVGVLQVQSSLNVRTKVDINKSKIINGGSINATQRATQAGGQQSVGVVSIQH